MTTVCFLIQGRVQGVGFRASARRKALQLGLTGSARNLSDGRVEVVIQGASVTIEAMALWLERGSAHARVDGMQRTELGAQPPLNDFEVG